MGPAASARRPLPRSGRARRRRARTGRGQAGAAARSAGRCGAGGWRGPCAARRRSPRRRPWRSSTPANETIREIRLSPDVFGGEAERAPGLRVGQAVPRRCAPRHAHDQEPGARVRLGQEALAAEGHRAGPRRRERATRCGATAARCSVRSPATTRTRCPRRRAPRPCASRSRSAARGRGQGGRGLRRRAAEDEDPQGHAAQAGRLGQGAGRGPRAARLRSCSRGATCPASGSSPTAT